MKIKFVFDYPLEESLIFESVYPENLRMDLKEKQELKEEGAIFITMIDEDTGLPVGETYFIPLDNMKEWDADEEQPEDGLYSWYGRNCAYVYSTTILPQYQNKGFGKVLKSFLLGYLFVKEYDYVLGHARAGASINLNKLFGANTAGSFDNWYKTGETYHLYHIDFPDNINRTNNSKMLAGKFPLAKILEKRNELNNE